MSKLTALAVQGLKHSGATTISGKQRPERHGDGKGLHLQVTPDGSKSWLLRFTLRGRTREMGLGRYDREGIEGLTLSQARDAAKQARGLLARGLDPIEHRADAARQSEAAARLAASNTFEALADRMLTERSGEWSNAKHRQQWRNTLATYCFPLIGKTPIAAIGTDDVERVLRPIWARKPETAGRVRMRVLAVLRYARAHGYRPPPAASVADIAEELKERFAKLGAMKRAAGYGHHPALDWREAPAFMAALRAKGGTSARALEFLILTAARTGEVLGAQWREIDLQSRLWVVPACRMKAGREHRVPLSDAAIAVLTAVQPLAEHADGFVFPGARRGSALSQMSLLMLCRKLCAPARPGDPPRWRDLKTGAGATPHGMRSAFRDWVAETTHYPREIAEAALAHANGNDVEAAYQRGDLLAKRAALMADWSEYLARIPAAPASLAAARARRARG